MSRIKNRANLATEERLVDVLRKNRIIGWRRHVKFFGSPDFVFSKARLVVFVDGCFWHGCRVHGTTPASNKKFWQTKLDKNKARDRVVNRTLRELGWHVLRIWQHELKESEKVARRVSKALSNRG